MKQKLLFILLVFISIISFSQEKTIDKLKAVPNPFTSSTKITFTATDNSLVLFTVKNVLGKTVFTEKRNALKGKNSFAFYKANLSSGIYIYTLQGKKQITSKRFVIQ